MATTIYFDEIIKDQNEEAEMAVEFGRSSFYSRCEIKNGIGDDSIYSKVDGKALVMDLATAKRFVEAAMSVGDYFCLLD